MFTPIAYQIAVQVELPICTVLSKIKYMPSKLELPQAQISDLYESGESSRQVAKRFDCDKSVILRILRENHVQMRPDKRKCPGLLSAYKAEVIRLYIEEFKTLREIATIYNTDKGTVSRMLKKFDIQLRTDGEHRFDLVCKRCGMDYVGRKKTRLHCDGCQIELNRIVARDRYRNRSGAKIGSGKCILCDGQLTSKMCNARYCQNCRQTRLNELKRSRRAKNPEKYRQKDKEYNKNNRVGTVVTTNRRARKYGMSLINIEVVRYVMKRDDYICVYCNKRGGDLTIDHVLPLCKGGNNSPDENLVTACRSCNCSKGSKLLLDFLTYQCQKEV